METYKISEDVATEEVKNYVQQFKFKPIETEEVAEDYPEVILAVQLGLLVFNGKTPTLTLRDPIRNTDGDDVLTEISFRHRILVSEHEKLASGVDFKKDRVVYLNKLRAHLIRQPKAMLDKFEPFDLLVIDQLSSLFT